MLNGSDILLMLDFGSAETPDYEVIGCQRDSTIEEASDTIDFSCKDSRGQRVDYGRFSSTVSLEALYISSRADFLALRSANRAGEKVILAQRESGEITQRFSAKIDNMSQSFPDQGESTIAIALQVDGFLVSSWVIGEGVIGEVFIS